MFEVLKKNKKRGSLLLEAILSIVILSISITVIIQSMTSTLRANMYSSDFTQAILLGENKIVELIQKGFVESGLREKGEFEDSHLQYKYFLMTDPAQTTGKDKINFVDLDVTWKSGSKVNKIKLETYLFDVPE